MKTRATTSSGSELRSSTGLSSRLHKFSKAEDGNMTIFSIFMFMGIVGICGVGVDLMMNEMQRTKMQGNLDNAVLAAAAITQERDAETVVSDYMIAGGLGDTLGAVNATRTMNESVVEAQAGKTTPSLFGNVLGVDELTANVASSAENAIGDVEISLVVDVSGSMAYEHNGEVKNVSLRNAATNFVDTVLDPSRGGLTSVNLVSYHHYTNIGPYLAGDLLSDPEHCYHFRDQDFDTLELSFSEYHNDDNQGRRSRFPSCSFDTTQDISVHQTSATALHSQIAELGNNGWTAVEIGMKWGLALLDPSSGYIVDNMIAHGQTPASVAARPAPYGAATNKYVVLMTDGQNTVHSGQDQLLADICAVARDRGVVIFGIAITNSTRGMNAIRSCASSDAHFFDVSTDIEEAFSAIAASISNLRLTQ